MNTEQREQDIWVPHEQVIRERLQFDLDQIRGITNHMPRDVAEGYEATVTTALTSLDALLARLSAVEQENEALTLMLYDEGYSQKDIERTVAMRARAVLAPSQQEEK